VELAGLNGLDLEEGREHVLARLISALRPWRSDVGAVGTVDHLAGPGPWSTAQIEEGPARAVGLAVVTDSASVFSLVVKAFGSGSLDCMQIQAASTITDRMMRTVYSASEVVLDYVVPVQISHFIAGYATGLRKPVTVFLNGRPASIFDTTFRNITICADIEQLVRYLERAACRASGRTIGSRPLVQVVRTDQDSRP
jgi:hypothetical protein